MMRLSLSASILLAATLSCQAFVPRYTTTSSSLLSSSTRISSSRLFSTLAPTSSQYTNFDDDDDDNDGDKNKKTTSTTTSPSSLGGISMSIPELMETLDWSETSAQLVWDCYSMGIDPANWYAPTMHLGYDDYESIYARLPANRRQLVLPQSELQQLAELYKENGGVGKVEGGVATLSFISPGPSSTKMTLKLFDGARVETVISPNQQQQQEGSSTVSIATQSIGKDSQVARSLSSNELLAQVFFAQKLARLEGLPELTTLEVVVASGGNKNSAAVQTATKIVSSPQLFPQLSNIVVQEEASI